MATVNYTDASAPMAASNAIVVQWTPMSTPDQGQAYQAPGWSMRSVQFSGTFGGATVVLEGSNDGVTYTTLKDLAGAAISLTAAGLRSIAEVTRYVRPSTTAGAGVAITVTMFMARDSNR